LANTQVYTQVFDSEYYSGAQVSIYIGDVWVDEVTSLSYVCQQNKTPLYGYASQLWDDCAAGQVLVQGSFSINFKEQGYLWAVLRRYHNISGANVGFSTARADKRLLNVRSGTRRDQPELVNKAGIRVGSNGTSINRQTIERVTQGETARGERFDFYHHLAGYSTFKTSSPRDSAYEDIIEAFEDQVWQPKIANTDLNTQLRRTDDNRFDGFDIYVVFGNYANPRANHTVSKIIDVRLLGQSKQFGIDGVPIQETYNFIARTIA
jgi:hypothetical protein